MSNDETFLARWSRRKIAAGDAALTADQKPINPTTVSLPSAGGRQDRDAAPTPPPDPADDFSGKPKNHAGSSSPLKGEADGRHEGEENATTPRALTEADFADVDFDALNYQSDYGRFMQAGVPESIRAKALHKLWATDTIFTQVDPFQDYAGDFTDKAVAVPGGLIKTAYKLGQGFLTDEEAATWDRLGHPEKEAAHAASVAAGSLAIARESPDQPEIATFLAASDAYMAGLYPAESNHLVDRASLAAANATFLVVRKAGAALGCGAVIDAGDGSGEIKRMWIAPAARGTGAGRAMLAALEAAARERGLGVLRLETGSAQPAALGLYRAAGFIERGPFGAYGPDPLSVFMEKALG